MLLWPLVLVTLLSNLLLPLSFGISTSSGPTSPAEAKTLWVEGQKALKKGVQTKSTSLADSRVSLEYALNQFQRLIARYQGDPHYPDANFFLGKTFVELGQFDQALRPLEDFVEDIGFEAPSITARLLLGSTYIHLKLFHEAFLESVELDKIRSKIKLPIDVETEIEILKARALMGMNQKDKALELIQTIEKKNLSQFNGQALELDLKIKVGTCSVLGTDQTINESQLIDQLDRRGTCLHEALLMFNKILRTDDLASATLASQTIQESFLSYMDSCKHPKLKPKLSGGSQKQYLLELSDHLTNEFKKKVNDAVDLMSSWKTHLSKAAVPTLTETSQSLQKLTSGAL